MTDSKEAFRELIRRYHGSVDDDTFNAIWEAGQASFWNAAVPYDDMLMIVFKHLPHQPRPNINYDLVHSYEQ